MGGINTGAKITQFTVLPISVKLYTVNIKASVCSGGVVITYFLYCVFLNENHLKNYHERILKTYDCQSTKMS